MRPSVLTRPTDRPPKQEAWGAGATMSFIAHAMLLAALVWGVHWRSNPTPVGTSAELWAAVPQISAPPPPPAVEAPPPPKPVPVETPPPPPVQTKAPDIVTEQDKQKKAKEEQEKKEAAERAAQKAADEKAAQDKAKADAEKQKKLEDKLRKEQLARMQGQLGAPADSTGTDARTAGPSANYLGRVAAILKRNLTQLDPVPGNPAVEVEIKCAPDGTILSWNVTKGSGAQAWDESVLRAIEKTGRLPTDTNGKAPSVIPLRWRQSDTQ
jgi:colicin import membrane protein